MPTFDLQITKNDKFYHIPELLRWKVFHIPGMLEPRNWVQNRAMYTPISISSFGSFTDTVRSRENADFRLSVLEWKGRGNGLRSRFS